MPACLRIGTAGWSVARQYREAFAVDGSQLERYAGRLNAVEINSSFYRPHRRATYERWAASVPADFRFAVKVPKTITHEHRLRGAEAPLDAFLGECGGLGAKLGPLLVQLPPSLAYDAAAAAGFFTALRARHGGAIVFEPRHASWFAAETEALLAEHRIARVAADPPPVPGADAPGGWRELTYLRLHGAPRIYCSDYAPAALADIAARLREHVRGGAECWCIFDNTAAGFALGNALSVERLCAGLD